MSITDISAQEARGASKERHGRLKRKAPQEWRAVTPYTIATTARIPKRLRRQVDAVADALGVSVTQIIVTALREYMTRHGYDKRGEEVGANG